MYAITGITGQVGGAVGRALLACGKSVRAVVRDEQKGFAWTAQGCDVAVADMRNSAALAAAFEDSEGVFILPPSEFDPAPGFPEARAVITAVAAALQAAAPPKVVCLSTIGAQARQPNLLTQRTLLEQALRGLASPVTFVRPAWFMENFAGDIAAASDTGVLESFLQPLDKRFPMAATADIGLVAAALLQQDWNTGRVVELEAARRITPNEVAAALSKILERPVQAKAVPREKWEALFKAQGMKNPISRMQMLDGFNEGWIEFERGESDSLKGTTSLQTVLQRLVQPG